MHLTRETIERALSEVFNDMRRGIAEPDSFGRVLKHLFPGQLWFSPNEAGNGWIIAGTPEVAVGPACGRAS